MQAGAHVDGDIVSGNKILFETHAPSRALHQLLPPPPDFTGRDDELRDLAEHIGIKGGTIGSLCGLGGIGKTALTLKLGQLLTPYYPDAQFYIDLRGVDSEGQTPMSSSEALAHVINAYDPDADLSSNDLGSLYRSLLHNQRAIIIADNAKNAEQVEPLIPPPSCVLLVTSREWFSLPGLVPTSLDRLPLNDAASFLLKICPRIGKLADELSHLCGCLPLAIRAVGAALATHVDLSPAEYTERLRRGRENLAPVDASLTLSYRLLSWQARRRFCALSVFSGDFDVLGASAVWNLKAEQGRAALHELRSHSLVQWQQETKRYGLHDVVRLFGAKRLRRRPRNRYEGRCAAYFFQVGDQADRLFMKGGESVAEGLRLFDAEWTNIRATQAWSFRNISADKDAAFLCNNLPFQLTNCLHIRKSPKLAAIWNEQGIVASGCSRIVLPKDDTSAI
jgi:hypothetical protein